VAMLRMKKLKGRETWAVGHISSLAEFGPFSLARALDIGLLGTLAGTVELKCIDRFLIPFGHHDVSPLLG